MNSKIVSPRFLLLLESRAQSAARARDLFDAKAEKENNSLILRLLLILFGDES